MIKDRRLAAKRDKGTRCHIPQISAFMQVFGKSAKVLKPHVTIVDITPIAAYDDIWTLKVRASGQVCDMARSPHRHVYAKVRFQGPLAYGFAR